MRRLLVLLLASTSLACGSNPQEQAVESATAWLDDVIAKDVDAACERMERSGVLSAGRFVDMPAEDDCPSVMRAYAKRFDPRKARTISDAGLEAADVTADGQVGVFPGARRHELEVLLMSEVDGEWKVVSVAIPPVGVGVQPE